MYPERELKTTSSSCPFFSITDRANKDAQNVGFWTSNQVGEMRNLHRIFNETFGETNVRKNINKKFFSFKIFKPTRFADRRYFEVLEQHLARYSVHVCVSAQGKIYRVNPR
jgi:hypothetical protein